MQIQTQDENLPELLEKNLPDGVSLTWRERMTRSLDAPTILYITLNVAATVDITALIDWLLAKIPSDPTTKTTYDRKEISFTREGLRVVLEKMVSEERKKTNISNPKKDGK